MRGTALLVGVFAQLVGAALPAQDVAGDWRGSLTAGPQTLQVLLTITNADGGAVKGARLTIDQAGVRQSVSADSIVVTDSVVRITFAALRGKYEGRLSGDGQALLGTWTQIRAQPLDFHRSAKETVVADQSPHSVRFIAVDGNVRLEVLDWGGSGRPVVLLAGLGNAAHVYDQFAPKLTRDYHVYGITRRGFGASSAPTSGYAADRLGDDVLAVLDTLALNRPVLVGHSIAGEELSSIGSRYPERVSGLVYLESGYAYAYYDREHGDLSVDLAELRRKLDGFLTTAAKGQAATKALIDELLDTDLPMFESGLRAMQRALATAPPSPPVSAPSALARVASEIMAGVQKYTGVGVPALGIYALPHRQAPGVTNDPAARSAAQALDSAAAIQATAFEKGIASARVVRLPNATHYVFVSNEADVLREMRAFIDGLPPAGAQSTESFDLADVGTSAKWKIAGRSAVMVDANGKQALRLSEGPGNGIAWIGDYDFTTGIIDVDLLGRSQPVQGSFIGIAFHVVDALTHDAVYFRPFNFRATDSASHAHAVQYVSHPSWPWDRLRAERSGQNEGAIVPEPDGNDWFHVRVVVDRTRVSVYVNGASRPSLVVDEMSDRGHGSVGLWVGNNSGGSFANLRVTRMR